MTIHLRFIVCILSATLLFSSCSILKQSAKYDFNDGIYYTDLLARKPVYVYKIDEDTIATFPVIQFPDSTAILTKQRSVYANKQKKFKDSLTRHTFYKPSFDVDVTTIPLKYRPSADGYPNQLTTNFNGAIFLGYRIDQYTLNYKRTPLNIYKQDIKHFGYSAGFFAGIGSTEIYDWEVKYITPLEYQGVTLITGIAGNVAMQNVNFGISLGVDHLLDEYHKYWVYQGKPCIGFTLGVNLN